MMKSELLIIGLMTAVCFLWGPFNKTSFSCDHEMRVKYYASCIVKEIVKCNAKFDLFNSSKSANLRDYAQMKVNKARFLEAEKWILVKQMLEMQLEQKQYKVELFLNSRFRERNYINDLKKNEVLY